MKNWVTKNVVHLKNLDMWEKTLKQIDHSTTPSKAASLWQADPKSLKLISDGINLVYYFEVGKKPYYLRITHEKIRNFDALSAAIDYQQHLFTNNAPICHPVPSINNKLIEQVTQNDLSFLVHVCNGLPGETMRFNYGDLSIYELWGKALAQLHLAAKTYRNTKNYKFLNWQDLQQELKIYLQHEDAAVKKEFQEIENWLAELKPNEQNYGLTHGDHRAGNVLYDGKRIYIIDFDEPVYHWFTADIVRPFLELCIEEKDFSDKFAAYLSGYQSILPVSKDQIDVLSWFIRMKILDIYLWMKNNWQHEIAPGGAKTIDRLHLMKRAIQNPLILSKCL